MRWWPLPNVRHLRLTCRSRLGVSVLLLRVPAQRPKHVADGEGDDGEGSRGDQPSTEPLAVRFLRHHPSSIPQSQVRKRKAALSERPFAPTW